MKVSRRKFMSWSLKGLVGSLLIGVLPNKEARALPNQKEGLPTSLEPVFSDWSRKATYYEVIFHPPRAHESKYVDISLNGSCFRILRGKRVVLPKEILEVADHAVYHGYRMGAVREYARTVQLRFPYTSYRQASYEEYCSQQRHNS